MEKLENQIKKPVREIRFLQRHLHRDGVQERGNQEKLSVEPLLLHVKSSQINRYLPGEVFREEATQ